MPFVWKQRGIQTQSAQLWQGMQGPVWASKERKRERGDWEVQRSEKICVRLEGSDVVFPYPPLYSINTELGWLHGWDLNEITFLSLLKKITFKGRVHPKMNTLVIISASCRSKPVWLTFFCRALHILWRTLGSKKQDFWNMRTSKWRHNFHFWMNYCFNFCGSYGLLLYVVKQQLEHSA